MLQSPWLVLVVFLDQLVQGALLPVACAAPSVLARSHYFATLSTQARVGASVLAAELLVCVAIYFRSR